MMRDPIAAWIGTSNICRGISSRRRSTSNPTLVRGVAMGDQREGVDLLAADEHVHARQLAVAEAREVVVEARVATRPGLQLVVEVDDDLAQWQLVGQQHACLGEVLHVVEAAAPLGAELHHRADEVLRHDHLGTHERLLHLFGLARHLGGVADLDPLLGVLLPHLVRDVRRRDEEVEVELLSSRSRTISMCSRPRKPQRNPKPSACDVSGS